VRKSLQLAWDIFSLSDFLSAFRAIVVGATSATERFSLANFHVNCSASCNQPENRSRCRESQLLAGEL